MFLALAAAIFSLSLPSPSPRDVAGAAEFLGVSQRLVRKLIADRRLAFFRVGRAIRIDVADLERLKAAGRVEALDRDGAA